MGGVIHGGGKYVIVPDMIIKTPAQELEDRSYVWLIASAKVAVIDNLITPRVEVISTTHLVSATPPTITAPTKSSPIFSIAISLGRWIGGRFNPTGNPDLSLLFCRGYVILWGDFCWTKTWADDFDAEQSLYDVIFNPGSIYHKL